MDEAQTLADRVAVMRAGKIVALDSPRRLGGRELRPSTIRFELPDAMSAEQLPPVEGEVSADGRSIAVRTHDTIRATATITNWALETGIELEHFSVAQPTLEDIYLELTGEHEGAPA
jgi:ABC-2 type transport system ATP-binding protein